MMSFGFSLLFYGGIAPMLTYRTTLVRIENVTEDFIKSFTKELVADFEVLATN